MKNPLKAIGRAMRSLGVYITNAKFEKPPKFEVPPEFPMPKAPEPAPAPPRGPS